MSLAGMAARHARRAGNNRFEQPAPEQEQFAALAGEFQRDPWDRNVPDPGRTIAITPEILAEEARKQQEREAAREQITWTPPAPLPASSYRSSPRRSARPIRAERTSSSPKPRRPRQAPAAPPPRPIQPQPLTRRPHMPHAKFTIKPHVDENEMPSTRYFAGRISPYLPLYEALQKLPKGKAQPVEVDNVKGGTAIQQALRKMAIKDKKVLISRRSEDGKTFYFLLTAAPEGEK